MRTPIALPLDDLNHRIHQSFKVWVSQELPFEPVWYWQVHWRNRLLSVSICLLISQLTRQLRLGVSFSCVGFKSCAVVSEPDTWKIKKEGLVCACRRTSDWLLISILEMLTAREPSSCFCFVLESCKHQAGNLERLYPCLVQLRKLYRLCKVWQLIKLRSVHF